MKQSLGCVDTSLSAQQSAVGTTNLRRGAVKKQ